MITQYVLGFMAGGLSLLAPCVLPLLPLILSSSLRSSKWGPLFGALGLTLSFTVFGVLSSAFASVFDPDIVRSVGAALLVLVGFILIVPPMKGFSSGVFQKVGDLGSSLQNRVSQGGVLGEFLGGALLGLIWSPCTGPTLALAIGLASQAQSLAHASLIFFFFGLGAGLGLVVLGFTIRQFYFVRKILMNFGRTMNVVAGLLSMTLGALILLGLEGEAQEFLLRLSPSWLTRLTVSL